MHDRPSILIINPGSTSTKLAVGRSGTLTESASILHPAEDLRAFPQIWDQYPMRADVCRAWAGEHLVQCDAVATIGGLLRPVEGGVYRVNARMLDDAKANVQGAHASNLGCALASELARDFACEAYAVDPVSVDEFEPLARYSGHPEIQRRSLSHAVSIHDAARWGAEQLGKAPEDSTCVVGHLGGGISIAAVRGMRIIDVNDASSDGPFSPERTGGLPLQPFISMCMRGDRGEAALRRFVMGGGGLLAYLGTNSALDVEQRITAGDPHAREIFEAMAYQIAKEIGAMAAVLHGRVDAVVLTGGLASSELLISTVLERVRFIAPVLVRPGEHELSALARSVFDVLAGNTQAKEYAP